MGSAGTGQAVHQQAHSFETGYPIILHPLIRSPQLGNAPRCSGQVLGTQPLQRRAKLVVGLHRDAGYAPPNSRRSR